VSAPACGRFVVLADREAAAAACFAVDFGFDWAGLPFRATGFTAEATPAAAFVERAVFPDELPATFADDRLDARAETDPGLSLESLRDDMPPHRSINQADSAASYINRSRHGCSYLSGCFYESRKTTSP